jgi:uncharacterized membrane protein YphA (DoxX/SURF4 family)
MTQALSIWLLVVAFVGAGLFNAIGMRATREGFVRWGYPSWWGYVTGGLEILSAILIVLPFTRYAGLILGTAILAAALITVLRHREFKHLAPIGMFLVLIGLAALSA